jgi:hypothetical protein
MLFFLTLQALAELTVLGSVAFVVDGLEGALSLVVPLTIHGGQGPKELAGGRICGGAEGLGYA